MEKRSKEKGPGSDADGECPGRNSYFSDIFTTSDDIRQLAAYNARAPLDTEEQMILFLQSWWSHTYNRPLKDPLLETYSVEELLYEFYDRIERQAARLERLETDDDRIEEEKERAVLDWADAEEKRELEEAKLKAETTETTQATETTEEPDVPAPDPTKDPENIAWMEKQLLEAKAIYGESFGEDIDENFDE